MGGIPVCRLYFILVRTFVIIGEVHLNKEVYQSQTPDVGFLRIKHVAGIHRILR